MTALDGMDGGKTETSHEECWKEVVRLVEAALAIAALRGPSGKKVAARLQRAMWIALRITPRRRRPLNAAELRRLGWAYADIASHLGISVARARAFVLAKNTRAHVRAMQTSHTARIDRWPLQRIKLDPAIQRALLNYAVVTVGHLLALDRRTLEAMGLDDRAIRAVFKAVPDLSERRSRKRKARAGVSPASGDYA